MSIYDDSAADDVPVWEPQSQPITLSEIAAEVGLSRDDIHQWMRVYSDFPKPLGLSGHDKTFDRAEVSAWLHKNRLHQYECANHNDWQTVRDMAEVIGMAPHRLATHLRRVPGRYPDGLNSDSPAVTTLNSCSTKLQSSDLTKPQADSCDDIYCRVHGYASVSYTHLRAHET